MMELVNIKSGWHLWNSFETRLDIMMMTKQYHDYVEDITMLDMIKIIARYTALTCTHNETC